MNPRTSGVSGLALAMVCCLSTAAYAAPIVTVGNYFMAQGTLGNPIQIVVAGSDAVQGLNFRLASGDEVSALQPIIATVDIIGPGTIFFGNNTGQFNVGFLPPGLVTNSTATTSAGTVSAAGTLANVTIDVAPGVPLGVYRLGLSFLLGDNLVATDFAGLTTILVDGTITVVPIPEPTSIVLALFAVAGLFAVAIRRRRKVA